MDVVLKARGVAGALTGATTFVARRLAITVYTSPSRFVSRRLTGAVVRGSNAARMRRLANP